MRAIQIFRALPLALCVLAASACTGLEKQEFRPLTDERFDARDKPAQLGHAQQSELGAQGYLLIGLVEVRQELRRCDQDRCIDQTYDVDATTQARELAARRGGDLIVLEKDNAEEKEAYQQIGRCRVPMMRSPIGPSRRIMADDDCLEYEIIRGVKELRVSQGFVWRREPDRASRDQLGRRLFKEDASGMGAPAPESVRPAGSD